MIKIMFLDFKDKSKKRKEASVDGMCLFLVIKPCFSFLKELLWEKKFCFDSFQIKCFYVFFLTCEYEKC